MQVCVELCADQIETSTSPPLRKPRAFELLKTGSFKFPPPRGQNGVQIPYPIVGFVSQIPLLKSNRLRLLSTLLFIHSFFIHSFFIHSLLFIHALKNASLLKTFFVNQSLTNVFYHVNQTLPSGHLSIAVRDLAARKKLVIET